MWMVGNRRRGWRVREIVVCLCAMGKQQQYSKRVWRVERERDNIVRSTFLDCKRRKNDK